MHNVATIDESQITLGHLYREDTEHDLLSILAANPSYIDDLRDHALIAYFTNGERRDLLGAIAQGDYETLGKSYMAPNFGATLEDARALAYELRDAFDLRAAGLMATCLTEDGVHDDPLPDWLGSDQLPETPKQKPIIGLTIDPRELWARHKNGDLAGDFFGQDARPVMVMPARNSDAPGGKGDWPIPPKRESKKAEPKGTVIPVTPSANKTKFQIVPRWSRSWEIDKREYYFRVKREVQKVHWHMDIAPMYYHTFDSLEDAERFIDSRRKAEYRARKAGETVTSHVYQLYYWVDGDGWRYTLVSNIDKGAMGEIPTDRGEAMALFDPWLNTPEDVKLNRHSQAYGGDFQGMSGDGRRKQHQDTASPRSIHLVTDMMPEDVKTALGKAFKTFELSNEDVPTFLREMRDLIPDLKLRGGGNPETAWRLACPQLTDTEKQDDQVCVSYGQNNQIGGGNRPKPARKQPVREEIIV